MHPGGESPHALCSACKEKHKIDLGDNEYFETLAYQLREEPPIPGKNYGGRRV